MPVTVVPPVMAIPGVLSGMMAPVLVVITVPVMATMIAAVVPVFVSVTMVLKVAVITVSVFTMTAIASIIVVESAHRIDHRIGDRGTDQDFDNTIAFMIGAGTEWHHQTSRYTGSDQPPRDGIGKQ